MTAQEPVFDTVINELRAGRKRTHWIWFIFPQLRGLGRSSMAEHCGTSSLAETRAYLAHPVRGPRLDLCTRMVLEIEAPSLNAILGAPDDMKVPVMRNAVRARKRGAGQPVSARY